MAAKMSLVVSTIYPKHSLIKPSNFELGCKRNIEAYQLQEKPLGKYLLLDWKGTHLGSNVVLFEKITDEEYLKGYINKAAFITITLNPNETILVEEISVKLISALHLSFHHV